MKKSIAAAFFLMLLFVLAAAQQAVAEVRAEVLGEVEIGARPLDMSVSADGGTLYVLTKGAVAVYSLPGGELLGKVEAGEGLDRIAGTPGEGMVVLGSSAHERLSILRLDFVQAFDLTGSPIRGETDAPVTITVFNDFQ